MSADTIEGLQMVNLFKRLSLLRLLMLDAIALANDRRGYCTVKVEKLKVLARLVTLLGYSQSGAETETWASHDPPIQS